VGDVDSFITVVAVEFAPHSQEFWFDAKSTRKRSVRTLMDSKESVMLVVDGAGS